MHHYQCITINVSLSMYITINVSMYYQHQYYNIQINMLCIENSQFCDKRVATLVRPFSVSLLSNAQPMGQGGNIHTWPRMFPGSGTSLCHAKQGAPKHVDDLNLMLGSLQWIGPSVTDQGRQCCKDIECVLPVASQFLQRW